VIFVLSVVKYFAVSPVLPIFPGTHEKGRRKKAESGKVRIKKSAKTFRLGMLAVFHIS
jgi:hypothetical protein